MGRLSGLSRMRRKSQVLVLRGRRAGNGPLLPDRLKSPVNLCPKDYTLVKYAG
jgi:hypothetical protein